MAAPTARQRRTRNLAIRCSAPPPPPPPPPHRWWTASAVLRLEVGPRARLPAHPATSAGSQLPRTPSRYPRRRLTASVATSRPRRTWRATPMRRVKKTRSVLSLCPSILGFLMTQSKIDFRSSDGKCQKMTSRWCKLPSSKYKGGYQSQKFVVTVQPSPPSAGHAGGQVRALHDPYSAAARPSQLQSPPRRVPDCNRDQLHCMDSSHAS